MSYHMITICYFLPCLTEPARPGVAVLVFRALLFLFRKRADNFLKLIIMKWRPIIHLIEHNFVIVTIIINLMFSFE